MYVTRQMETLYLRPYNFNVARVLTEMAKKIKLRGGNVETRYPASIILRGHKEVIKDLQQILRNQKLSLGTVGGNEKTHPEAVESIRNTEKRLNLLNEINATPATASHLSYIRFILEGIMYYFQVDDNLFLPDYYLKTHVINGEYSRDACLDEIPKTWQKDVLLDYICDGKAVSDCADYLLDFILNAQFSVIRPDTTIVMVPNTYNGGYHRETIQTKRTAKVDF